MILHSGGHPSVLELVVQGLNVILLSSVSARATLCLLNSTEVEVDTGPYFGGRISVEPLGGAPGDLGPDRKSVV